MQRVQVLKGRFTYAQSEFVRRQCAFVSVRQDAAKATGRGQDRVA